MIHEKDLMLGNFVFCKGGNGNDYPLEIISINEDTVGTSNYKTESNPQFHCDADYSINEIYGISLTEEILLKCGYVPCSFTENHFNIKGHRIWECNEMFLCDKNGIVLTELHQLQNLYKILTKQELEIKL